MTEHRSPRRVLAFLLCALAGACLPWTSGADTGPEPTRAPAFDPATGDTVAATAVGMFGRPIGAAVRVRYVPPGPVHVARRAGARTEELVLDEVRELTGRLRASRGDTLFLAVSTVSGAHGRTVFPATEDRRWWVRVARGADVRIDLLSRNPSRTERVTNAVVTGAVFAGLGAAAWCVFTRCGD